MLVSWAVVVVVEMPKSLPTLAVVDTAMLGSGVAGCGALVAPVAEVVPIPDAVIPPAELTGGGGVAARGVGIRG